MQATLDLRLVGFGMTLPQTGPDGRSIQSVRLQDEADLLSGWHAAVDFELHGLRRRIGIR